MFYYEFAGEVMRWILHSSNWFHKPILDNQIYYALPVCRNTMLVRVITRRLEITAERCVTLPDGDTHSKAVRFHSRTVERTNDQYQYLLWPVNQSNFQLLTVLSPLEAGKKGFVGSGSDRLKQTSTEILAQVRKRFYSVSNNMRQLTVPHYASLWRMVSSETF